MIPICFTNRFKYSLESCTGSRCVLLKPSVLKQVRCVVCSVHVGNILRLELGCRYCDEGGGREHGVCFEQKCGA